MAGVCIVHVVDITLAPRNEKDKYMLQEEKREEKRKPMERILAKLEAKKDEDIIKSTESNIEDLILEKNFKPNEGTSQQHKQLNRNLSNLVPRVRFIGWVGENPGNEVEIRVSTFGKSLRTQQTRSRLQTTQ